MLIRIGDVPPEERHLLFCTNLDEDDSQESQSDAAHPLDSSSRLKASAHHEFETPPVPCVEAA